MKKNFTIAAIITFLLMFFAVSQTTTAQSYGIVFGDLEVTESNAGDIFGDGLACYLPDLNTLVLKDGFKYHLSHGKVIISTGNDFTIKLEGNAEIYACVECEDNVLLDSKGADTLSITSNISGSALKCRSLFISRDICLNLLSRNSQENMYALDCGGTLTIENSALFAEVTTASMAVKTNQLEMKYSYLLKPHGGSVNPAWGGICFSDGLPAKTVWIVPNNYNNLGESHVINEANVQKIYKNGQILIIKDGKQYNIAGQQLN
jgi:hypothetical protein